MAKGKRRKKQKEKILIKLLKAMPLCVAVMAVCVLVCTAVLIEGGYIDFPDSYQSDISGSVPEEAEKFAVYFIDVGQGDCTLIRADNSAILIDAGEGEYGGEVVRTLKKLGIEKLDHIIATHPHSDHMGGLPDVIDSFPTDSIIAPKLPDSMVPTTVTYEKFLLSVQNSGSGLTAAKAGTVYDIAVINGKAVTMTVLSPSDNAEYDDLNDYSVCVRIDYGVTSWLFTGDISKDAENELIASGADIDASVYKVSHHGSSGSSCSAFLDRVTPQICVISCGKDNSYGHPHSETLERLSEHTDSVYRTDRDGNITAYCDGSKIYIMKDGAE